MPEIGSVVGGTVFDERPLFLERPPLWTPAQLGSDLALWLDAQDEGTLTKSDVDSDGTDEVKVWADKSGNGNDASQAQESLRPGYDNDAINGYAALHFDGVDDFLESVDISQMEGISQATVFAVYKNRGSNGDYEMIVSKTQGGSNCTNCSFEIRKDSSDTFFAEFYKSGNNVNTTGGSIAKEAVLHAGVANKDVVEVWGNGEKLSESSPFGQVQDSTVPVEIGARTAGGFYAEADIAEVVLASARDTDNIFGWAAHKYNLTDKLPSNHPYKDSPPTV